MHEIGIMSNVIKSIEKLMEEENLTQVEKIVLEVGELSGVVPKYIEDCYKAVTYKTRLQETELEMIVIPGEAECMDCGEVFNGFEHDLVCPKCKSVQLIPLTGKEFMIKEIIAC